jgi:hypothetical protein
MLQHVLQMGNEFPLCPGWNRGLVHVERAGKAGADLLQVEIGVGQKHRIAVLHQGEDLRFRASDRRQGVVVHGLGECGGDPLRRVGRC